MSSVRRRDPMAMKCTALKGNVWNRGAETHHAESHGAEPIFAESDPAPLQ